MRTLIVVLLLTTTAPAADRYYSRFEWGTATTGPRAAEVIMEPTDWELVAVLDGAQSMTVERLRGSLQGSSPATQLLNFSTAGEFSLTDVPVQLDLNPVTSTKWESAPIPFAPHGEVSGDYQSVDFRNQFELELPNEQVQVLFPKPSSS